MSGQEALEKIKNRIEMFKSGTGNMYALIILDYSLGGDMDGPDVKVDKGND